MTPILLCTLAACLAGAINAFAGGGTFFTFPALTGLGGLSEKLANVTSTVGNWPGSAASLVAAREDFRRVPRGMLVWLSAVSVVGGIVGSLLLLNTSERSFGFAIPWLLLAATLLFAFSKRIAAWAGRQHGTPSVGWTIVVGVIQFGVAVYGGYFGAGIGVLMLGGLAFLGLADVRQMNALKVLMQTVINAVAIAVFATRGDVAWAYAAPMAVGSAVGGFAGMALARRVSQAQLRAMILAVGAGLTVVYFWKTYG